MVYQILLRRVGYMGRNSLKSKYDKIYEESVRNLNNLKEKNAPQVVFTEKDIEFLKSMCISIAPVEGE